MTIKKIIYILVFNLILLLIITSTLCGVINIYNTCHIETLVNDAPIDILNFIPDYNDCSDMSIIMIDWLDIHGYENYTYLVIGSCPYEPYKHAWVELILNNETIYIESTMKKIVHNTSEWRFYDGVEILNSEQFWRFNSSMDTHLNFCPKEFNLTRNSLIHK